MRKSIRIIACISILVFLCGILLACDKKNTEEEQNIILMGNGGIRSCYILADGKSSGGIDRRIGPSIEFASKKPIGYVKLTGVEFLLSSLYGGHNSHWELTEIAPKEKQIYKGYYYYAFPIEVIDYGCPNCVSDQYESRTNLKLEIDGEKYVYEITYATGYYDSERPFVSYNNMSTSSKDGIVPCGFKATEDIEVISIRTRGDAIVSDEEKNVGLFDDLPKVLSKGEEYKVDFNWKLKDGVEYGADYMIVEYKKVGDDTLYYSPFGYMAVNDTRDWKNWIDEVA